MGQGQAEQGPQATAVTRVRRESTVCPRVPTPWPLHPSGWTPRPGWLLLSGLSSTECDGLGGRCVPVGWECAHGLCFLAICHSLQCAVKEGMTGDFLFSKGPVMAEACISPRDGLCSSHGSLRTHTQRSASARVRICQDGVFVREAKASLSLPRVLPLQSLEDLTGT